MKLYEITDQNREFEKVFQVYVIAQDEKHAERAARLKYWDEDYRRKNKLSVREVDLQEECECIIGTKICRDPNRIFNVLEWMRIHRYDEWKKYAEIDKKFKEKHPYGY